MGQIAGRAQQRRGQQRRCLSSGRRDVTAEHFQQLGDDALVTRLVEADAQGFGVDQPQVIAALGGRGQQVCSGTGSGYADGVEGALVLHPVRARGQPRHQPGGQLGDARSDSPQAVRPVPLRVEGGDDSRQDLRGADVAGRLLAADVLLAGLQSEAQRGAPAAVDALPDEPARQLALLVTPNGHVRRMRTAEPQRQPEALRRSDRDVGAGLPGGRQQRQREQVSGDDEQRTGVVHPLCQPAEISDPPGRSRVLREHPERPVQVEVGVAQIGDDRLHPDRLGPGRHHIDRLRVAVVADDEGRRAPPHHAARERHRLGRSGALVEQAGVGHVERREVADHGLERQQRLEPALADLRLVRGVGGVPGRVFEHVAQQDARREGRRVARSDERAHQLVARREPAQLGEDGGLGGGRRKVRELLTGDSCWQHGRKQLFDLRETEQLEHLGKIARLRGTRAPEADVSIRKGPGHTGHHASGAVTGRSGRPPSPSVRLGQNLQRHRRTLRSFRLRVSGEVAPSAPLAGSLPQRPPRR